MFHDVGDQCLEVLLKKKPVEDRTKIQVLPLSNLEATIATICKRGHYTGMFIISRHQPTFCLKVARECENMVPPYLFSSLPPSLPCILTPYHIYDHMTSHDLICHDITQSHMILHNIS